METENTQIKDIAKEEQAAEANIVQSVENSQQQTSKKELTQDQAMRKSLKVSYAIRSIAGMYLLYVAFQMYRTMDLNSGGTKVVSNMFMVFFAIVGLVMLITSFNGTRKLMK